MNEEIDKLFLGVPSMPRDLLKVTKDTVGKMTYVSKAYENVFLSSIEFFGATIAAGFRAIFQNLPSFRF
jgi:hypothetical protein